MKIHKPMAYLAVFLPAVVCAQTYDLPLLVIQAKGQAIVDEPKIVAELYAVDKGGVNQLSDTATSLHLTIGIEQRGQTSASFDQKGYGFEIRDALGDGLDTALFGLPAGDDWVLHGPFVDKSLIRNAIAHELYRNTGRYAVRTKFVELFLDNQYQGVYLLLEKIKRGKDRVDIGKMAEKDTVGDDLTGGYIFRVDKSDDIQSEGFVSTDKLQYIYHYPKKVDLLPQQQTYITNTINAFESMMASTNWNDPTNGYSSKLDLDAAADYILHEEMTKNSDAYFCSFYMHKDKDSKGGKIVFGPPWDFNLAFGQVDYNNNMVISGWQAEQNMNAGVYKIPSWLKKLFGDPEFKTRMKTRWSLLRSSVWHTKKIHAITDSLHTVLGKAASRHFAKWDILGKKTCVQLAGMGGFGMSFCFNGYSEPTWDLEVTHMETWFLQRIAWIDEQFGFTEPAEPVADVLNSQKELQKHYRISGNRMYLAGNTQGRLQIRNLKGVLLWQAEWPRGEVSLALPETLPGSVWIATLNGKPLSNQHGYLWVHR